MRLLILLLLLTSTLQAQTFTQLYQLPFVITDIDCDDNGDIWTTQQQGVLFKGQDTVATFPVQFVNECGLVGLHMSNQYAYLHLSGLDSVQRVIRYDTILATIDTLVEVSYKSPYSTNHRGGDIFVRDSFLFCSFGYGSYERDAQDFSNHKGSLIIMNLNTDSVETIVFGLRNPMRFDMDGETGFITDVGSNIAEEVNFFTDYYRLNNFMWPCFEGDSLRLDNDTLCRGYAYSYPEFSYYQDSPRSIIGGVFWNGDYYFTDHYSGVGGSLDVNWIFSDFPIPFPQFTTAMCVDPITNTLLVSTWAGKIFRYEELPLSIEDIPKPTPKPAFDTDVDYEIWLDNIITAYGDIYFDILGREYVGLPEVPGMYFSYWRKTCIIVY